MGKAGGKPRKGVKTRGRPTKHQHPSRKKGNKGKAEEGEDKPSHHRHRCVRRLTLAAKLTAGGAAIVQWVSSTQVSWPAGEIAFWLLGLVAAAIFSFHLTNVRTRIELRHWATKSLQQILLVELLIGCGLQLAVLALVVFFSPTWLVLALIAAIFLVGGFVYELTEEEIRKIVDENPDLQQGTSRFARRRPLAWAGIDRSIGEMAEGIRRLGPQRLLGFWVKPPWSPSLSRTRTVILYAMLLSAFVAFTAAANVGLQQLTKEKEKEKEKSVEGGSGTASSESPIGGSEISDGGTTPVAKVKSEAEEGCLHLPSFGAPAWARNHLNALYYGTMRLKATPAPGYEEGGCTGLAVVPASEHGTFVYTIGRNELGEVRSVAVDSFRFEPAIFLAPAAQRVLALLKAGVAPLGGYPLLEVAGGDAVPITTERGTFVLVRSAKTLPGSDLAMPYVVLPPTAAAAWITAMKELGIWLWPLRPQIGAGKRQYPLVIDRTSTDAVAVVTYGVDDGSAEWNGYDYFLPEHQIDEGELKQLAETAR
jgi:hypothetical protein